MNQGDAHAARVGLMILAALIAAGTVLCIVTFAVMVIEAGG